MEAEGVAIPSVSSSPPLVSDDQPESSPAGSPDLSDHRPSSDQLAPVLTDDLRDKIIKQVEYYFSDENLPTDKYLLKCVSKDKGGYVPIGVVASFRKMKKLTRDTSLIVAALRQSSLLVVSGNGKKVKRLQPLPLAEVKDPMLCTVLVENLPADHSVENLQRIFGEAGKIQNIVICDPHAPRDSRKATTAEKLLSVKLHALVEYDTVEAAEKAVANLNNEQDWRFGLRVKLLKNKIKAESKKKVWREAEDDKNRTVQATTPAVEEENPNCSSDHHDDSHDEEEEHLTNDKTGEHSHSNSLVAKNGDHSQKENNVHRNRSQGRGRKQKYHGTSAHGHGTSPSSYHVEPSKPPPGPKMPDGTRGFTIGRGRPLQLNPS